MSINQLLNQYEESSSQREQGINNYLDKNYGTDSAMLNLPVESAQSRLQDISNKFMDEMGIDFGAKGLYSIGLKGVKYAWGDDAFKDLGNAIGDRLPSFSTQDLNDAFSTFRSGTSGLTDRITNGFNSLQSDLRRVPVRTTTRLEDLTTIGSPQGGATSELADWRERDVIPSSAMDVQSADMGGLDLPTYSAMDIAEMSRESAGLRARALASSRERGLLPGGGEGGTQTFQYQGQVDPATTTMAERYGTYDPASLRGSSTLARATRTPDLPSLEDIQAGRYGTVVQAPASETIPTGEVSLTPRGYTAGVSRGMEDVPSITPTITPPISAVRQQEQVAEVQPTIQAPGERGQIPQEDPTGLRGAEATRGAESQAETAGIREAGQTAEGEMGAELAEEEATTGMLGEVFSAIPVLGEIGFGIAAVVEGVKAASEEASATAKIRGAISDAEFESGYETLRPAVGQMSASSFDTAELSQGLFQHF